MQSMKEPCWHKTWQGFSFLSEKSFDEEIKFNRE